MKIEVTRSSNNLNQEHWAFNAILDTIHSDYRLVLTEYAQLSRPTNQHEHDIVLFYSFYNIPASTILNPPLPQDVSDEAYQKIVQYLAEVISVVK